ncbi:MAG: YicC family protein [Flavobacteriales bacterium]|nr:YicC family protein [Flavobacteriales bacterium]MBO73226.1 YicC family protein [Flavobacteriales bacterium]
MTGFGKARVSIPGKNISIEIKSLNSKQQDFSVRMPGNFKSKEMEIRKMLQSSLFRGKVECNINVELTGESSNYTVNTELVKSYFEQMKPLLSSSEMTPEVLSTIMRMPDVMNSDKDEVEPQEWDSLKKGISEALNNIVDFRNTEGKSLENDLIKRMMSIEKGLETVKECDVVRVEKMKERLNSAISEIKEDLIDKNRFEQEVIYYLEKLDINEEKVRLAQHCKYFRETLSNAGEKGKKLGFIAQEMGREINTIGSKANDAEIQKTVVLMKDSLEKIKEQILNIL